MSGSAKVFTIQPGAPFLPTLVEALLSGRLVPGFRFDGDPLALADATIFVPTRRAARALRAGFAARIGNGTAILPVIRPLGEFDEDEAAFDGESAEDAGTLDLAPPIGATDRLLLLAPLVRAWKRRLPAHVAALFEEEVVVPASTADAVWLARDLARLKNASLYLIPASASTGGHGTTGDASLWVEPLKAFLATLPRRDQ